MTASLPPALRRIATGLDPEGRSAIALDASLPPDERVTTLWHTPAVPADNSGAEDPAAPFGFELMHGGGTVFLLVRMPVGARSPYHATDTIDYITMLSGRVILELETGDVALEPGTFCIDRGIRHGWRNEGPEEAVYTVVTIPALPVGAGASY